MLEFEESGHVYRFQGREVPSVTTILASLESFAGVSAAILEAAREFGQHAHLACHLDNAGELDEESLDPALAPYVVGWRAFKSDTGFAVTSSEVRLYHATHKYAGTADAIGTLGGKCTVVDIKSGVVPATVGAQLAAYQSAATSAGTPVKRRLCVQLIGDGQYKLHEQKDPADWNLFLSALNIHHWLIKRNRTYGRD